MQDLSRGSSRNLRHIGGGFTIVALSLVAAVGLSTMHPPKPAMASIPNWDASRFLLNALLAPALDADAVPLRWADPRAALRCGPASAVTVNREPLRTGALVPDVPFELDWMTDDCRPFGADGPRLDGRIRLMVYREDWGWSATVEPAGFRVTSSRGEIGFVAACGASMPQDASADDPMQLTELAANEALPCR